jgi:hypothetical protein
MREPVTSDRRFTGSRRCPVCGGAADDPPGNGVRCWGFISDDQRFALCTRDEHAGSLSPNGDGTTYAHLLIGACACGEVHDAELRRNRARTAGRMEDRTVANESTQKPTREPAPAPDDEAPSDDPPRRDRGRRTPYEIRDPSGTLIAIHLRIDYPDAPPLPNGKQPKEMPWRQPDGTAGLGGLELKSLPLFGVHRLVEWPTTTPIVACEGEKKTLCLTARGIPAVGTCCGAKTLPDDEALRPLLRYPVVLWPDNDDDGREHMKRIAERLKLLGHKNVRRLTWPEAPDGGDAADFFASTPEDDDDADERRIAACREMIISAPFVADRTVWDDAESAVDFLNSTEPDVDWFEENVIARGVITELFAPRGVGKSHYLHAILVKLAKKRLRCLLLDRDNPRSTTRARIRQWCAGDPSATLKIMTRERVPPLTDKRAWAMLPFADFDVVAVDSLDATAEGVGDKDSAKPSAAIAPLLDLCHRQGGPAVIVLGNTVKTGAHSRGSGVIEDRGDISLEVRDATGLVPTGKKPWWYELPDAGVAAWAERANRRKRRTVYRLAFVSSKFRVGEEPDPWLVELRLPKEDPWTIADVTHDVVEQADTVREETLAEQFRKRDSAARMLYAEIRDRDGHGLPEMHRTVAEAWLMERGGLSRAQARDTLDEVIQPRHEDAVLATERRWLQKKGRGRGAPLVLWCWPDLPDRMQYTEEQNAADNAQNAG